MDMPADPKGINYYYHYRALASFSNLMPEYLRLLDQGAMIL